MSGLRARNCNSTGRRVEARKRYPGGMPFGRPFKPEHEVADELGDRVIRRTVQLSMDRFDEPL
jgi:hypothetical protein